MVGSALGAVALPEVSTWPVRSWVADARWRPVPPGERRNAEAPGRRGPVGRPRRPRRWGRLRRRARARLHRHLPASTRRRHPGYLILHEPIATQLALGVAVVLVGVALTRRKVSPKQIVVPGTESVHSRLSPGACGKKPPPAEQPSAKATTQGVVTVATRALKRGGSCKPDDGRDGEVSALADCRAGHGRGGRDKP